MHQGIERVVDVTKVGRGESEREASKALGERAARVLHHHAGCGRRFCRYLA